jgi:rhodanese-related sulfurtransferase
MGDVTAPIAVVHEGLGNSSYLVDLGDGALTRPAPLLDGGPVTVMCGHGERAMTAASLLTRHGHHDITVAVGGPGDWAAAHGRALETGP